MGGFVNSSGAGGEGKRADGWICLGARRPIYSRPRMEGVMAAAAHDRIPEAALAWARDGKGAPRSPR